MAGRSTAPGPPWPRSPSRPGDLAVTTDYRTVLGEVLERRLRNPAVEQVFPGFVRGSYLGVCRG